MDFPKRLHGQLSQSILVGMSLDDLLRRQAGVLSLRQAVELGMSRQTVHRRVREGSWTRLHPCVYLVGGHRLTDEVRVRAAWLWSADADSEAVSSDVAVSGVGAAFWHGLVDRAPLEIGLTVPSRCKPRPRPVGLPGSPPPRSARPSPLPRDGVIAAFGT